MGVSAVLMMLGKKQAANFIGQWVPSILVMGTYNKIAKTFSAPTTRSSALRHGDHPTPMKAGESTAPRPLPRV